MDGHRARRLRHPTGGGGGGRESEAGDACSRADPRLRPERHIDPRRALRVTAGGHLRVRAPPGQSASDRTGRDLGGEGPTGRREHHSTGRPARRTGRPVPRAAHPVGGHLAGSPPTRRDLFAAGGDQPGLGPPPTPARLARLAAPAPRRAVRAPLGRDQRRRLPPRARHRGAQQVRGHDRGPSDGGRHDGPLHRHRPDDRCR